MDTSGLVVQMGFIHWDCRIGVHSGTHRHHAHVHVSISAQYIYTACKTPSTCMYIYVMYILYLPGTTSSDFLLFGAGSSSSVPTQAHKYTHKYTYVIHDTRREGGREGKIEDADLEILWPCTSAVSCYPAAIRGR